MSVEEPSPAVPTLMSAPVLRVALRDEPLKYLIETALRSFVVGSAEYEVFGRPYRHKWKSREWLTESPVAIDASWRSKFPSLLQSPLRHILFTSRRVTLRTPTGEVICIVDQRGHDPRKSGFRFLSADETLIGAFNAENCVFDRHNRAIAQYRVLSVGYGMHVIDNDGAPIVKLRRGRTTKMAFLGPTSREVRLLMICTMLAVAVERLYKEESDSA